METSVKTPDYNEGYEAGKDSICLSEFDTRDIIDELKDRGYVVGKNPDLIRDPHREFIEQTIKELQESYKAEARK